MALTIISTGAPQAEFPATPSMFVRYAADADENTSVTVNQTFATTDVDTTNNQIALPDALNFGAPGTITSPGGVPVFFSSTDTLPVPLEVDTPYILSRVSTGQFRVFPVTTVSNQPGALSEETPLFAQDYMQQSNPVVLTDQGSGVHTIFTDPLVSQIADLTGNGYPADAPDANDRNRWLQRPNDDDGRPVFRARLLARSQLGSSFAIHGNGFPQGGDKLAARQEVEGARTVWHTYVAKLANTDINSLAKAQPSSVNTTTGVITATGESNSHPFSAIGNISDRVRVAPVAGSLPTGLTEDTDYWVDRISSTTFTLHTTEADANAGTNPIIPSTSPAEGDWMVWAPEKPGNIERARFFTEHLEPASGGNALSPRTAVDSSQFGTTFVVATDFVVTGTGNGRLGTPGRDIRALGNGGEVSVWFPPEAVAPIRNDTSVALANGIYWISLDPQSSVFVRLHDTEASALAAVGINTVDCDCIKYDGTAGSGFVRIEASGQWPIQVGVIDNAPVFPDFRFPLDELGVVTFKVDYLPDDPATTPRITIIFNSEVVADYDGPGTKGLLGTAVDDGSAAWMFMNSPQGHVPFEGDIYDAAFGASTGVVDNAELIAQHDWAIDKYINPFAVAEGAVSKPVNFAVGGKQPRTDRRSRTQILSAPGKLEGGERASPSSGVRRLGRGPAPSFTTRTDNRGFD